MYKVSLKNNKYTNEDFRRHEELMGPPSGAVVWKTIGLATKI